MRKRRNDRTTGGFQTDGVDARVSDLVSMVHPGQKVYPRTIRTLFGRVGWDTARTDVSALREIISDDEELRNRILRGPSRKIVCVLDDNTIVRRRLYTAERGRAIVDINNIVWSLGSRERSARYAESVLLHLRENGVEHVIGIADANVRYVVSDPDAIARLAHAYDRFEFADSGTPADQRIIEIAKTEPCFVVSNDMFREYRKRDGWSRSTLWRILAGVTRDNDGKIRLENAGEELYDRSSRS